MSNFLEWSGISDILVDLEDYVAILVPMLWFFFFYSLLQILSREELKKSEQKYRYLFEESPLMILLINKEGKIVDFNSKVISLSGYEIEELSGRDFWELIKLFSPEYLKDISEKFRKIWKIGSIEPFELQYRTKDSNLIWLRVRTSTVNIESEIFIQLIIEDIEKVKQAEKLIKQEVSMLKELDQMKTDLVTRVSHELKTPLVLICGATELILRQYKEFLDARGIKLLKIIEKGGIRLDNLISNLIDVSRIESSKLVIKTQKENICKILQDCIKEIEFLASKRNIQVYFEFSDTCYIDINKDRIEQVILNLLTNAIKNTPPNGKVSIVLKDYTNFIEIFFKDTGVGFTEKEKEKLFKKFGKIERYGKGMDVDIEGAGLGLYITKEIIELHNGNIWVESEGKNCGSTFIIQLPK